MRKAGSRNEKAPQVLTLAGLLLSEYDGTRTRNHRIDSPEMDLTNCLETQAVRPIEPEAWGQSPPPSPELQRVVRMWGTLPEAIRTVILTLIDVECRRQM